MSSSDPQAALDLISDANRKLVQRAKAPGWYHWVLGLLVGGLCAVQPAGMPWVIAYYAVYLVGLWLIVRGYRRHTGMWIPGYRAGRTRRVAFGLAAIVASSFLAAILFARRTGFHEAYWIAGALQTVVVIIGGYVWQAAFRRDLGVEKA
jgi:hypothetical protein